MKKILIPLILIPLLGIGAFLIYQNRPEKQYASHITKARLYAKESNLNAALKEYELAYKARGGFTPYSSIEVLKLTNALSLQKDDAKSALENSKKFVELYPTNRTGKLLLAELAFRLGEVETALNALTALLKQDPKHVDARLLMASLRTAQRRYDLAEEEIRIIYENHPDSLIGALPLAKTLLAQGKTAESRELLARILTRHPKDTATHLMLVDSYLREGRADSVKVALEAWSRTDPAIAFPIALRKARLHSLLRNFDSALAVLAPYSDRTKENTAALLEVAKVSVKKGRIDSAIALYESMKNLKFMPAAQADYMAALLHLAAHHPAGALECIKRLQVGQTESAFLAFELAAYIAMDQPKQLAELLETAADSVKPALLELHSQLPPDIELIGGWGLINYYQAVGEAYLAFRATDSLYKRWPGNPLIARSFVQHLLQVGAGRKALEVLSGIKEPRFPEKLQILDLRIKAGEFKSALAYAEKLSAENPKAPGLNNVIADLHRATNNRPKMMERYRAQLEANPKDLVTINNLAWEYGVVDRDYQKAEPLLRKLEESKNTDPRVLDTIGWILALNGKHGEAGRYFDLAISLLPDNPAILYHSGWLKIKVGAKEEGTALVRRALASKRTFPEKAEAQQLLAANP